MILIGGTNLEPKDLPFNDVIRYNTENSSITLGVKLKAIAVTNICIKVYLHSDKKNFELSPEVKAKTEYFDSDEDLIAKLKAGGLPVPEEEPVVAPVVEAPVMSEPIKPKQQKSKPVKQVSIFQGGSLEIEDVDMPIPSSLMQIPNFSEDTDSLKLQLKTQQNMLDHKDTLLNEIQSELSEVYRIQDIQMHEIKNEYEDREGQYKRSFETLKQQVASLTLPPEEKDFLKFVAYSKNARASLKEEFKKTELTRLNKLTSPMHILASGGGDSLIRMLGQLRNIIDNGSNAVIVDFSNDFSLCAKYNIDTTDSSLNLNEQGVGVAKIAHKVNNVSIIPTSFFNDIAFLTMDWMGIINRVMAFASGRPIIFVFGSISSFAVRYTVSKLSTLASLNLFVKCNPLILNSFFGDVAFIPRNRFKIIAVDYIEVVLGLLQQFQDRYSIKAYVSDVKWHELGIE